METIMIKTDMLPIVTPYIINKRSKIAAVAVVLFIIALILQLVGLCTPGWAQSPDTHLGLFTYCGRLNLDIRTESIDHCATIPWRWEGTHVVIHVVRAAGIISFLLSFISTVMATVHLWIVSRQEHILTPLVALCLALSSLAVVTSIVTCLLFGTSSRESMRVPDLDRSTTRHVYHLSYSFATFLLGIGCLVAAIVLVLASVKSLTRTLLT